MGHFNENSVKYFFEFLLLKQYQKAEFQFAAGDILLITSNKFYAVRGKRCNLLTLNCVAVQQSYIFVYNQLMQQMNVSLNVIQYLTISEHGS